MRMVQSKWQRLPGHRSLKGRAGHTVTLVGKKLFVIGGRNANVFYNDVWVFDTEKEQWHQVQAHASLSARAYHTTTLVRDTELWVIGGSDKDVMYGDIHIFNTDTLEWASPVAKGPLAGKLRGTHAAVVHPLQPNAILVYGGFGGLESKWLDELAVLHTDTLQWEILQTKGETPSARGYHTLTTVGNSVVLFGGKGNHGICTSNNNLSVYNTVSNTWIVPKVHGTPPIQRSNHAAALLGDNLIVIHGGRNGTERLSDMCALKISPAQVDMNGQIQVSWLLVSQDLAPKPASKKRNTTGDTLSIGPGGRAAHSLIAKDSTLYIFGGYGGQGVTFDDIHVLRHFPELASPFDPRARGLSKRGDILVKSRRFSFPIEEENAREPVEGWRSTKKPRRPSAGALDYTLVSNDRDTHIDIPSFTAPEVPKSLELQNDAPLERELEAVKKQVQELVSKARSNGDKGNDFASRELDLHHNEVASMQGTVTALKCELRAKSLAEADLQELNSVLKHNLEVHRCQVVAVNEKIEKLAAENSNLKLSSHMLETKNAESLRDKSEMVAKLTGLEEKLAYQEREHNKTLQLLATTESKVVGLSRSLEEARKEQRDGIQENTELRIKIQKLEMDLQNGEQLRGLMDREKESLLNQVAESKNIVERVSREMAATKDSTRTLQETVERLAKQLERENLKVDALEHDREELRQANAMLSTDISQITTTRESAEAGAELVRKELRTTRVLLERSEVEVARVKDALEEGRQHAAALHTSLAKNEEDLKVLNEDNERWRKLVREVEDFEQTQARTFQSHIEKIRCARQMYPC